MAVKRLRQENKERTRAALLHAARRRFIDVGYAATKMDDVAADARVSKGSVYYHFGDKAQLFEAVFRQAQEQLIVGLAATAAAHDDPWERFHAAVDAYFDGAVRDADHRALLHEAPAALGAERCQQIDETLGLPVIATTLHELAAADQLIPPPTEMLARVLFSALCTAAMSAGAAANPAAAEADARTALDSMIRGLRKAG